MTLDEVRVLFGAPEQVREDDESPARLSFLDGFIVHFREGRVELIELAKSSQFSATFHAVSLHDLPANDAVRFVCHYAAFDPADPELGHTFVFPEIQLALWRPAVPDPDQPSDKSSSFHAVSIGVAGYFDFRKDLTGYPRTRSSRVLSPKSGWETFRDSQAVTDFLWERCRDWHYMNPAVGISVWEERSSGGTVYVAFEGENIVEFIIYDGETLTEMTSELESRFGFFPEAESQETDA
jgi:hypothetical protein